MLKHSVVTVSVALLTASAVYFFLPPADKANAQNWSSASFQDCIINNLKDVHADRAVPLLEQYCMATAGQSTGGRR